MSPSDPFEVLAAEHVLVGDQLTRALRACEGPSSAERARSMRAFADGLRVHVRREERSLFPVCEELFGGKESAVAVLRADHAKLKRSAASLIETVRGLRTDETRQRLQELFRLLKDHFAREERVLFPLAATRMSPAQAAFVARHLRKGPSR